MSQGQKSFVKGAAILGFFGLIVKLIGAFFRVPLTNIIGPDGMAYYQAAYPVYATLVVISTAGLPAAISKLVSERVTLGDYRGAHKVFQKAFKMLLIFGVGTTIIMFALSGLLADAFGMPGAEASLRMIAPSLFFVSVLSAYRGYFQGLQHMFPTAVTQLIEQVVKLGAGLYLASAMFKTGGVEAGAAGALLGVSISELLALIVIVFIYNRKKNQIKSKRRQTASLSVQAHGSLSSEILRIALPVTLGACMMPIVGFLDTLIVTNTMAGVDYSAFNPLDAKTSFGLLTGAVNTLVNMPAVLSVALCMSLVPAIAEARAKKDTYSVSERSAVGFKLAALIGLPCAMGMYLLAGPIISLLYTNLTADELAVGTYLLQTMSIGVLFLTMLQTMTGILQGAGRAIVPVINLGVGAIVKIIISILLIRVPSININGAAIGTAACYGIAAILNLISVVRITKPSIQPVSGVMMPIISTAIMGTVVYFMYKTLNLELGNTKTTIICIAAAVLVYVVMLFITRSLKKDDMKYIPGGGKITRVMNKFGFWED